MHSTATLPIESSSSRQSKIPHLNELLLSIVLQSGSEVLREVLHTDIPISKELLAKVKDRFPMQDLQFYSMLAQQGLFTLNEETLLALDLDYLLNTDGYLKSVKSRQLDSSSHLGSATPVPHQTTTADSGAATVEPCTNCADETLKEKDKIKFAPNLNPPRSKLGLSEEIKQRTKDENNRFPDEL